MWSVLCILRFPDADAYYNQGVLLNKMCDKAKFGGAKAVRLPALNAPAKCLGDVKMRWTCFMLVLSTCRLS